MDAATVDSQFIVDANNGAVIGDQGTSKSVGTGETGKSVGGAINGGGGGADSDSRAIPEQITTLIVEKIGGVSGGGSSAYINGTTDVKFSQRIGRSNAEVTSAGETHFFVGSGTTTSQKENIFASSGVGNK